MEMQNVDTNLKQNKGGVKNIGFLSKLTNKKESNTQIQKNQIYNHDEGDPVFEKIMKKINIQCVMNSENLLDNQDYTAYSCLTCPDKIDLICQFCYFNCHKDHNTSKSKNENSNFKKVSIKSHPCKCAMKEHEFINVNNIYKSSHNTVNHNFCPLMEIFSNLNPEFYYFEKESNKYFCFYCVENCLTQNHRHDSNNHNNGSLLINKNLTELMNDNHKYTTANTVNRTNLIKIHLGSVKILPVCSCEVIENHEPFFENTNSLRELITMEKFGELINKAKLPALILSDFNFDKYLDPLVKFLNKNYDNLDKEENNEDQAEDDLYDSEIFKSAMNLLKQITARFGKNFNPYLNFENKFSFFKYFSFEFMMRIFDDDEKSANFIYLKGDLLRSFRKLYIIPLIKFKNFSFIEDYTNTSVLHRLILGKKFPLDEQKKQEIFKLLKLINKTLFKAVDTLFDDDSFGFLFTEYLKLLNLILSFNDIYLDNNLLSDIFLDFNYQKQKNSNLPEIEEIKTETTFDEKMSVFIDKISEYVGLIKPTDKTAKILTKNYEKLLTKLLVLKNDYIFFTWTLEKEFNNNMKFSFEDDKFNEKIIKLIFSFSTNTDSNFNNISDKKFYEFILNPQDYYVSCIKTYFNSTFNYLNDDVVYIMNNKFNSKNFIFEQDYFKTYSDYTMRGMNEDKITFIEESLGGLYYLLNEYFTNIINDSDFFFKIKINLENLEEYVLTNILNLNIFVKSPNNKLTNEALEKLKLIFFRNQIVLYKLDFFNILIYLWTSLMHIESFKYKNKQNLTEKRNSILEIILRLLDYLTYENPFLTELFFNKCPVEFFVDYNEFYIKKLKTLKKYNYKINLNLYIKEKIKKVNFDEWFLQKEKISEILKIFCYTLNFSSDKTSLICNSQIYEELYKILTSKEIQSDLISLIDFFTNISLNVKAKSNDYGIISSISYSKEFLLIKNLYKSIFNLKPEYFYLINDKLNIDKIRKLISIDYTLDPMFRIVFTDIYFRYYCEGYFFIKGEMDQDDLNELSKKIDFNLLTKIEAVNNEDDNNLILESNHPKNELKPILFNLEIYRLMNFFHEIKFKGKLKKIVKYFNHLVLKPVIFSVYKIIYFAKNISAEMKYIIFKCIFLFLECEKHFLEIIKNGEYMKIPENIKILDTILFLPFETNAEIQLFITNTHKKLVNDVILLNSNEFEQLNLNLIMSIFAGYLNNMNYYRELPKDEDAEKTLQAELEENIIRKRYSNENNFNSVNISEANPGLLEINNNLNNKNSMSNGNLLNSTNNLKENFINENADDDLVSKLNYKNLSRNASGDKGFLFDTFSKFKNEMKIFINTYEDLKINFSDNNIMNKIYNEEFNPEINHINYKLNIAMDLYAKLDNNINTILNPINEENTTVLESVNKLFKCAPDIWQEIIINSIKESKSIISSIIEKKLAFLLQYILIEFNRLNTNKESRYRTKFISLIEFLRLLCESHNKIFQTLLINYKINEINENYFHFNFILKIPVISLQYLHHYRNKKDIVLYFKKTNLDFFEEVLDRLTEYNIELIQGCISRNFTKINQMAEFSEYYDLHYKFFDFLNGNKIYENILANFIKFINCYIEENSNDPINKVELIKKLNPKKLNSTLIDCFYELYRSLYDIKKPKNSQLPKDEENLLKDKFLDAYLYDINNISENPLFTISFGIFKYFKRVSFNKNNGEKVIKVLDSFQKTNHILYNLFNFMIRDVEIVFKLENSLSNEYVDRFKEFFEKSENINVYEDLIKITEYDKFILDKVIFLIHPDSIFNLDKDVEFFKMDSPFDNFNTKLNYFLEYYPYLIGDIQIRKIFKNLKNEYLDYLYNLDYTNIFNLSVFFSTITCLLMILNLEYVQNEFEIKMIFPYKNLVYTIVIIHNIYCSFFILTWSSFNIFKLWVFRSKEENNLIKFILKNLNQIFDWNMYLLQWNFFFGFLGLLNEKLNFLFALQLFSFFFIVPTMNSVIYSVRIRYKQFGSTGFLLVILILFYASITYYFFRDGLFNEDLNENICESYFRCFLYLINYGIRTGSGIEFGIKKISDKGYIKEFLFGWMFYFIIMLIILNIVNGIIVDTFQALREQNNKKEDILENFCYVCSLERSVFEIKGINYEKHILNDHYIKNYFDYLIKIQRIDEYDLNSLDSQVLQAIKENRTDFFPNKKAKALENAVKKS